MIEIEKGISLDRLRTFCLVVQTGSIAAAALNDPNQQSQFSRQIKDLEGVLGKKLLRKEGRTLKPTEAGFDLAALASSFFAGLDDMRGEPTDQPIVIAAGESILRWVVLPAVSRMTSSAFHWRLKSMRTLQTMEALGNGNADLGVVREDAVNDGFASQSVGAIHYVWLFPRSLLPGRTAAGVFDAKRLPFALLAGDGKLARLIIEMSTKHSLPLDILMELESFSLLVEAVKTRKLGAVIPRDAVTDLPKDEFAVIEDEQLAIPSRSLLLVAHEKSFMLRPRIRNAFDGFVNVLASRSTS